MPFVGICEATRVRVRAHVPPGSGCAHMGHRGQVCPYRFENSAHISVHMNVDRNVDRVIGQLWTRVRDGGGGDTQPLSHSGASRQEKIHSEHLSLRNPLVLYIKPAEEKPRCVCFVLDVWGARHMQC